MSIKTAFESEGIDFPYMNQPESNWDMVADVKVTNTGKFVICPYCRKKLIRVLPDTKIHKMPYVCKGSNCKREFLVEVE